MGKKSLLSSLMSFLALLWLPSMCQSATVPESPQKMIEKLASSQKWADRVAMTTNIDIEPINNDYGVHPYRIKLIFHCDDQQRVEWLTERWRTQTSATGGQGVDRVDNNAVSGEEMLRSANDVINGEEMLRISRDADEVGARARISRNYEIDRRLFCDDPEYGSVLVGRIFGNNHLSVAELLQGAQDVKVRQEALDGEACAVIKGRTPYGSVTVWIAPDKGYNALKWEIRKGPRDLFNESEIESKSWLATFHATELRRVQAYYIPIRSEFSLEIAKKGGGPAAIDLYNYTVENIDLHPDFDALKAFEFNLPNGTPVSLREAPGISYIWRDGRAVPDVEDEMVSSIDSLVSKAMQDAAPKEDDEPSAPKHKAKPVVEDVQKEATRHAQDAPAIGWGLWRWGVITVGLLIIAVFAVVSCLRRRRGTAA